MSAGRESLPELHQLMRALTGMFDKRRSWGSALRDQDGKTVCTPHACAACMACVDACRHDAITIRDTLSDCSAVIDSKKCIGCGACQRVCPQLNPVELRGSIKWQQGWASDCEQRAKSSSGGIATEIARAFIENGGTVCSCRQIENDFTFELTDNPAEMDAMRGSKYVKSNPVGSYRRVRDELRMGRKVLFIGLPCQVAAVRSFVGKREGQLYTVDLICHGTPSCQLLREFLLERNKRLSGKAILDFRKKIQFCLRWRGGETGITGRRMDPYTIAFLEGLSYTENCYSCRYARGKRVSDITLGDSWGTELVAEESAGVSLVLTQTTKGFELLRTAAITLLPVDAARARGNNGQLSAPTPKPANREIFFRAIQKGESISHATLRAAPLAFIKRSVKSVVKSFLMDRDLRRKE